MPTETFRSEGAYKSYLAYTHTHGIKTHAKRVCIKGGKCHTVKHSKPVSSTSHRSTKRRQKTKRKHLVIKR
jgi:hypothetical protein